MVIGRCNSGNIAIGNNFSVNISYLAIVTEEWQYAMMALTHGPVSRFPNAEASLSVEWGNNLTPMGGQ